MAGLGRRTFAAGEVLTASNVMGYLQDQAVMNFAGTAARGSAIGTAVSEGMVSYLADSNTVQAYDGSAWNSLAYATAVPTLAQVGLVPIIAPTVNYSGGTATANSLGQVSFTSVTSLSLNNVFSSSYTHYRILSRITYDTGRQGMFRMRNSGTDNTSAVYYSNGYYQNGSNALSAYQAQNDSKGFIGEGTTDTSYSIDIFSPFETKLTRTVSLCSGIISSLPANHNIGCLHSSASSFDGITILPSAGNMTGIIQVYGYRA